MTDWISYTESTLGIQLKKAGPSEYAGPCPWCGGVDRFRVWTEGNYWCRPGTGHCGKKGWLDKLDDAPQLTEQERLALRVEALERKQAEHERRLSALEYMHQTGDHLLYHKNLTDRGQGFDYWTSEGMAAKTISDYHLGYCQSCPTAPDHDSYTIPVICQDKLYNIRHRLASPTDGGKYRPHRAGLPSMLFNFDHALKDGPAILVLEGEKKSMVVTQETGLLNVATMGAASFKTEWAAKLRRFGLVYVCYDPDAIDKAAKVAHLFGKRGRVVNLPVKADDFFVRYGGTAAQFTDHLTKARPV